MAATPMTAPTIANENAGAAPGRELIHRHSLIVRLVHWIIVACVAILLMSGLQIFNAHPALYWGSVSHFDHPLAAVVSGSNGDRLVGAVSSFRQSPVPDSALDALGYPPLVAEEVGFPWWITLPHYRDLAMGRRWHFFFAWLLVFAGAVYFLYGFISGHFARDLFPSRTQMRNIGRSVRDHLRLRFPSGTEAKHYNVLQRLAYLCVVAVIVPLIVVTGLAMSPGLDSVFPFLPMVFGGRQSARTIHFIAAFGLVAFALIHILMVLLSGFANNVRSMITGRYVVVSERPRDAE
jgi:thiosulfate reductase cytochrome b subunit